MSSKSYKRFQSHNELNVSVGSYADKHRPVLGNWKVLLGLVDHLSVVSCQEPVVLSNDRVYLVQDFFASEENGTTYSGHNIYHAVETITLCVQTEASPCLCRCTRIRYVKAIVQE